MKLRKFGADDPLAVLIQHPQVSYLRCYLLDLHATWVLEETRYFDRDYLEEHAAYYASLAAQHSNLCRRLHFFNAEFSEALLEKALGGDESARTMVQAAYLGFSVIRPLDHAPLGRTVVQWYPDRPQDYGGNPRIDAPSRDYVVHIAGVPLHVRGLACP